VLSGTAVVGQTLSTSTGSWSNSPSSYTYRWQDCDSSGASCVTIAGAVSPSYALTSADVGHTIRAVVTASNAAGSRSASSAPSGVVTAPPPPPAAPSPPANTALPQVSGSAAQGSTLTTTNGSWSNAPSSYAYQWQDCDGSGAGCGAIAGAVSASYTLTSADVGHTIRAVVTASNAGGSASASSAVTAIVSAPPPPAPVSTAVPQLSGTPAQGNVLSTSNGSWSNSPSSYGYQWQDCDGSGSACAAISGATSSTHTLTSADVGHTIRAVVTASNAGGSASASSAATAAVTGPVSSFVTVCGSQLCLRGTAFRIKGATAYGQYGNASSEIATAKSGGLNTLELVEFDSNYHDLADTEASDTWNTVDAFIAAAGQAGLHVVLNLSEYGQSLQAAGYTMSSAATGSNWPNLGWQGDWNQYVDFIANRVNTVSGVGYKNDPTIAMVEIWGEIPAPNGDGGPPSCASTCWTTAQMQAFYANTEARWHADAPNILISSGGFSYLNDSGSGIPWQAIMSNSSNAVCDLEINSYDDRDTTVPMVTPYCQQLAKPWFLAAWSACSNSNQGSWDINNWLQSTPSATDTAMAAHVQNMYAVAAGSTAATYPAIGSDFWNLGPQTYNTCDLGPSSPESPSKTWAAVQAAS
jgi:hypothetical protein